MRNPKLRQVLDWLYFKILTLVLIILSLLWISVEDLRQPFFKTDKRTIILQEVGIHD